MTCQARKLAPPLSVRTMTSGAGGNILFWNSIFEDPFSRRYACFWDPTNRSGVEAMKLRCDRCYLGRTENVGDTKHDVVCPSPFDKRAQLVLDILNLLSGESRDAILHSLSSLPMYPYMALELAPLLDRGAGRGGEKAPLQQV